MCTDIQKVSGLFDEAGPYINIGAFPTVEKLEEHFVKIHGNPETIKFQCVMYVPKLSKQSFQNFCKPYSNVYTAGKNEEVTIIYKKNPTPCVDHNFTVMNIIDRNFLKHNDIIDDIKKKFGKTLHLKLSSIKTNEAMTKLTANATAQTITTHLEQHFMLAVMKVQVMHQSANFLDTPKNQFKQCVLN